MPSISVEREQLMAATEAKYTDEELSTHLFNFGVEVDDVYEEDGKTMYKLDISANRYDLLCVEGLSMALRAYLEIECYPELALEPHSLVVLKEPTHERTHIACAVIRGIDLSGEKYASLIAYQEKLHSSIGRGRSLVAIGTHDLYKISGQIKYRSANLKDINFTPLNNAAVVNGSDLAAHYVSDKRMSKYFGLLSDSTRSVVFEDGEKVLSLPPIINSEATKVTTGTRDLFVEVTGTEKDRVETTLKMILFNFRGASAERVAIKELSRDGQTVTERVEDIQLASAQKMYETPVFINQKYLVNYDHAAKWLNINPGPKEIVRLLNRMMHKAEVDSENIMVHVPDVRQDILHECDILEDIAIAYGYENFAQSVPAFYTIGREDALNKFTDKLRVEFALSGYIEALTLTLLSADENFVDTCRQAMLENPKSREYEVVRTSLLPGLLKTVGSNLHAKIPIRLFEAADVVILDVKEPEGARNERRLAGCISANTALLEELQGPLTVLLQHCGFTDVRYEPSSAPYLLERQSASVVVCGAEVGFIGVLRPSYCSMFKIPYATSVFELNLSKVFSLYEKVKAG